MPVDALLLIYPKGLIMNRMKLIALTFLASLSLSAHETTEQKRLAIAAQPEQTLFQPTYEPMEVHLVDHMGSDLTVVNAARVSFNKESNWKNGEENNLKKGDKGLIRYLARNNHWTPFGHAFATFRIKAPLFVARQLVKHTVGLCWNEVSRRYVTYEPTFYAIEQWRGRPKNMKQGSKGDPRDMSQDQAHASANHAIAQALTSYMDMLQAGVAPEQARMVLPQTMMTEWYWSGSLAAWARVCKLRLDPHAQQETAVIAQGINEHLKDLFPVSWSALVPTEKTSSANT